MLKSQLLKRSWPLALLLVAVAWYWLGKHGANADAKMGAGFERAVPVAVTTVNKGELQLSLNALGTVIPAQSVTVKSRVEGQLLRVHFKEGQTVKAGDLLAEIDPRPFEVQLAQAEGQLARDTALLKNAQIDLERYQTLWSQDSIAKQEVDAQAALVRQYEGAVKVDEGAVADAKLQLTYSKITAPISGRVGLRQVDPGNIVHTSDTTGIVTITQVQPVYVVFTLPEDNLPRLLQKINAKQTIAVDAYDRSQKMKLASGALMAVDNQIDTATGTLKIKAEFSNDNGVLFPNQFVNARVQIENLRDMTLVPVDAVQSGAQGSFVYALQSDNTVKLQNVQIGESDGERVVIDRGIEPGMAVVVEGIEQLRDGSNVDVVQRDGQKVEAPSRERTASAESVKKSSDKSKKPAGE
ncbi:MAG: MdtA/MuxA family multidrug efflux RND transporter periplasmic adaptor subunit [Spongiibacteraceae bacterium]